MSDDGEIEGTRPKAPPRPGTSQGVRERRRHPRLELRANVQVRHATRRFEAQVRDLSRSGVRLVLPPDEGVKWARSGQTVQLKLEVVGIDAELVLEARIVWARRRPGESLEVGLEFQGLDVPARRKLGWIIDNATDD